MMGGATTPTDCHPSLSPAGIARVWNPLSYHVDATAVWLLVHLHFQRSSTCLPHLEVQGITSGMCDIVGRA